MFLWKGNYPNVLWANSCLIQQGTKVLWTRQWAVIHGMHHFCLMLPSIGNKMKQTLNHKRTIEIFVCTLPNLFIQKCEPAHKLNIVSLNVICNNTFAQTHHPRMSCVLIFTIDLCCVIICLQKGITISWSTRSTGYKGGIRSLGMREVGLSGVWHLILC